MAISNRDGHEDFAVVVIDRVVEGRRGDLVHQMPFALLVFNGPPGKSQPAFFHAGLDLRWNLLFAGRDGLGFGEDGKDGYDLEWRRNSYVVKMLGDVVSLPLELGISGSVGVIELLVSGKLVATRAEAEALLNSQSIQFDSTIANGRTGVDRTGWLEIHRGRVTTDVSIQREK